MHYISLLTSDFSHLSLNKQPYTTLRLSLVSLITQHSSQPEELHCVTRQKQLRGKLRLAGLSTVSKIKSIFFNKKL